MQIPKLKVLIEAGAVRAVEVACAPLTVGIQVNIPLASPREQREYAQQALAPDHARALAQAYLTQTGMLAAVVISIRVFIFRGEGKAN